MKKTFALFLIFASFSALAQDLVLESGEKISEERLRAFRALLEVTDEDTTLYHWTNKNNAIRWVSEGQITPGEMNFLNTPSSELQSYGPGFYLAENPTSSNSFGEAPVSITIKKGTPLYNRRAAVKAFGFTPSFEDEALIAERLSLLRPAVNDWYVVNNADFTKNVVYANYVNPEVKVATPKSVNWSPFVNAPTLKELAAHDQDVRYLRDVIYASDYMDGVSFARAMKINPGAPWMEFEPENFERYKNTIDYLAEKDSKNARRADILNKKMRSNFSEVMLEVHNKLSGKNESAVANIFRTEGVRAGGDEAGQMFEVTKEQLEVLQKNPYLEVEVVTKDGKILVDYHYPDVFHYKKLKGIISDRTYQTLEKTPKDLLMNDAKTRNALNKTLISELYYDFVEKFAKGKADWVDLISIHPFPDYNGRTVRLLQKIADPSITHTFLGDLDVLLPKEYQSTTSFTSSLAQNELMADLYDELLKAKTEKRMPDYLNSKAIDKFVNNAYILPTKIDLNSNENLDKIAKRKWPSLFDEGVTNALKDFKTDIAHFTPDVAKRLKWASHPQVIPFYSDKQKSDLALMLSDVIREKKVPLMNRVEMFQYFDSLITNNPEITSVTPTLFDEALGSLTQDLAEKIGDDLIQQKDYKHYKALESLDKNTYRQIVQLDKASQKLNGDTRKAVASLLSDKLDDFFRIQEISQLNSKQLGNIVEIYNRNLTEILNRHADFTSYGKILETHRSALSRISISGLMTEADAEKIVLKRTLPLDSMTDLKERSRAYQIYAGFYEKSSSEAKAAFTSPDAIWTKLEADLFKDTTKLDNALITEIANNLDFVDRSKKIDFLIKNYDRFNDPNYIKLLLIKELKVNMNASNISEEAKARLLSEAPEVFEFLHQKGVSKEDLASAVKVYEEVYESSDKKIRSQLKSPREIAEISAGETSIQTWAGNCVSNILKTLFP